MMGRFGEKERSCQASFERIGKIWHVYTSGKESQLLFARDEDFVFVMNVIAQAAYLFGHCIKIIAFEVMNNHFHFVIIGNEDDIRSFFKFIQRRLSRVFPAVKTIKLSLKPIEDLQSVRNNIVYVNRNGYVANPAYTPFSYPWGTGRYYFNNIPTIRTFSDVKSGEARAIFRGRDPKIPANWAIEDGHVTPPSFCAIKLGMAFFRDAHHYFSLVSKNIESYSQLATELDDGEFLTDQEMFSELQKILKSKYDGLSLSRLSPAQKLDLARDLHFNYRSSNGQIRRLLGLSQYELDQLFPPNH